MKYLLGHWNFTVTVLLLDLVMTNSTLRAIIEVVKMQKRVLKCFFLLKVIFLVLIFSTTYKGM